jgi:SAM-dependent methyltransferase
MRETHSAAMRLAQGLGFERIAWSLRRLHCPVDDSALVLEVGSGGNPYPRANVLLDAYEATRERHWVPLTVDRPTVLGFVEALPFRDQAFDFVIASHVLEHSADPARFLGELQRVAKAGYIEVPDAFMERVNPYHDHRLEITTREGRLVIPRGRRALRTPRQTPGSRTTDSNASVRIPCALLLGIEDRLHRGESGSTRRLAASRRGISRSHGAPAHRLARDGAERTACHSFADKTQQGHRPDGTVAMPGLRRSFTDATGIQPHLQCLPRRVPGEKRRAGHVSQGI